MRTESSTDLRMVRSCLGIRDNVLVVPNGDYWLRADISQRQEICKFILKIH
jgi:hypothetical protein